MDLRLLLDGPDPRPGRPVVVSVDDLARPCVGAVLEALALPLDSTSIDGRATDPTQPAHECLVDGATLTTHAHPRHPSPPPGPSGIAIAVVAGPDAGRALPLPLHGGRVGRNPAGAAVIDDRTVSRGHLEIHIAGDEVSAHDLGSVNGSRTGNQWLTTPTPVAIDALVHLGASTIRFESAPPLLPTASLAAARGGRIALVRPPRQRRPALSAIAPPPRAAGPSRLMAINLVAIAVPVLFALLMAVVFDPRFALMGLIGPLLAVSNHFGQRRRARRDNAERATTERQARARFRNAVIGARDAHEHDVHRRTPDLVEIARRIGDDLSGLWERRPSHDDFLLLSVGFGSIEWTPTFTSEPRDIDEAARAVLDEHRVIDDAPIVVDACMPIGIRGEASEALALARALLMQAAALHGPADLRIVVATTDARCAQWHWTEWLPHTFDPRADIRLVAGGEVALRDTVEQLLGAADGDDIAHTLVIVDDASLAANRATPVRQLLAGLHGATAIVIASTTASLPSLCHTVIDVAADMAVTVTVPARAAAPRSVRGAGLSADTATRLAAGMARFVDPEASTAAAPLPAQVALLRLFGNEVDQRTIEARWDESRAASSFVVPIGVDGDGPLMIDLVHDGPHILVAGTTGSGKSELLRTLIASLAATVDAQRVNFLLIDYKGGSAFDRCAALPHTVGVVTDLDGRLTARALTCLEAELRRRERALRQAGVDDIATYHRRQLDEGRLDPLPRLVVVVDEFAALVSELPQFVDALIDVGQRGRSLGVHIVLATQRPSGVVKDALRANANLRISLRVLDQNDSRDVVGVTAAALISRRHPGRAIAWLGAAELLTFQTATVTGRTARLTGSPVQVSAESTPAPAVAEHGPSDLARLVDIITGAHTEGGYAAAWRPWPDPLPLRVALGAFERVGTRSIDEGVVLGLADAPHEQRQETARWHPHNGPLLVQSLRGGGATTALSTIAVDVARSHAPDRVHLYVLDLGAGDLAPLAALPHCGAYIAGHETERTARLLRMLGDELHSRKAGPNGDCGRRPVIVVLIDNIAAFTSSTDAEQHRDTLRQLIGDGAAVDIHLALSTDRAGALGHAVETLIAQRVLLRLADAAYYAMIGVRGVDPAHLPPGRGFLVPGATEIQIALPGDAGLPAAVAAVCAVGAAREARPIAVLPSTVSLRDMAVSGPAAPDAWIIGLLDRTLGPAVLALAPGDHALIAGPARAGKSSALGLIAHLAQRDGSVVHVVAPPRSPLRRDCALPAALTADALAALVDELIHEPPTRRHVIAVDDADLVDEGGHLERLLATHPLHVHVVAAARADRLRAAYRHWTIELRRSRIGILLRPDDIDGELLGVRLPRGGALPPLGGRGYLVTEQGCEIVQMAMLDAQDSAA